MVEDVAARLCASLFHLRKLFVHGRDPAGLAAEKILARGDRCSIELTERSVEAIAIGAILPSLLLLILLAPGALEFGFAELFQLLELGRVVGDVPNRLPDVFAR